MRLGILGGTFNPIHFGHLRLAEEICEELSLDKALLMPGAEPPHKDRQIVAPFTDRLEMAGIAVEYSDYLEASDIEGCRKGPSYSIETIRIIRERYKNRLDLFFILGSDAFKEINTWKEYKNLFQITNFVIIERPGFTFNEMDSYIDSLDADFKPCASDASFKNRAGNRIFLKKTVLMDISSTKIRQNIKENKSINFLVPQKVKEYIFRKGLYK